MSTAADQAFVAGWRSRRQAALRVAEAWRAERFTEAVEAAEGLMGFPGVTRVVLFGSLARGEAGPGSDVDLWVEGLADADWLDATQVVRAAVRHAEVDVVRAECASDALRAGVAAQGVVLRER